MHQFPKEATPAAGVLEKWEAEIQIVFQLLGLSLQNFVG